MGSDRVEQPSQRAATLGSLSLFAPDRHGTEHHVTRRVTSHRNTDFDLRPTRPFLTPRVLRSIDYIERFHHRQRRWRAAHHESPLLDSTRSFMCHASECPSALTLELPVTEPLALDPPRGGQSVQLDRLWQLHSLDRPSLLHWHSVTSYVSSHCGPLQLFQVVRLRSARAALTAVRHVTSPRGNSSEAVQESGLSLIGLVCDGNSSRRIIRTGPLAARTSTRPSTGHRSQTAVVNVSTQIRVGTPSWTAEHSRI